MSATSVLLDQLQGHYINPKDALPGGLFLRECGLNGVTGSRVDALYVGFTSASGRALVGHEVKVARSDWLRELDHVGKADTWADQCHQWWIVTTGPDIVSVAELPPAWGLLYPNPRGRRMKVVRAATHYADRTPSWLITRSILARQDTLRARSILDAQGRLREESHREVERRVQEGLERRDGVQLTREQAERLRALDDLEQALGMPLHRWDSAAVSPETAAAALRLASAGALLTSGRSEGFFGEQHLRNAVASLAEGLAELDQARTAHRKSVPA